MKRSLPLQEILNNRLGYRTESYSGSGVRDVEEVLRFEITELSNTDVIAFMKENYGILSDVTLEELDAMCEISAEVGYYMIEQIMTYVTNYFKTSNVYALWLTTKEGVEKRYASSFDEEIDAYAIPNDYLILSDLGRDGALFVFKQ